MTVASRIGMLVAAAALVVAACGDASTDDTGPVSDVTVLAQPAVTGGFVPLNSVILRTGIGDAPTGLTAPELGAVLGPTYEVRTSAGVVPGTEGVTFLRGGVAQLHALHLIGEGPELDMLVTDNTGYRTPEGIGPGVPLDRAIVIYGAPRLTYSLLDEGREFVVFEKGPGQNIVFRATGPGPGELAGIYPEPLQDYNETAEFQEGSAIAAVWVFHDPQGEPGDETEVVETRYVVAVDSGSSLNIRSGPAVDYEVIDEFDATSTEVIATGQGIIGDDGEEWWEVQLPNEEGTGWVAARFLARFIPETAPPTAPESVREACRGFHAAWGENAVDVAAAYATDSTIIALFSRPYTPAAGLTIGGGETWCIYDNGTEFAEVFFGTSAGSPLATDVVWYPADEFLADENLVSRFNGDS